MIAIASPLGEEFRIDPDAICKPHHTLWPTPTAGGIGCLPIGFAPAGGHPDPAGHPHDGMEGHEGRWQDGRSAPRRHP
jgi:hypothetical protein